MAFKAVCWAAVKSFATVANVPQMNEDYHKRLTQNDVKAPQLYLYRYYFMKYYFLTIDCSKDDPVVPFDVIETFWKKQQERGIYVTPKR